MTQQPSEEHTPTDTEETKDSKHDAAPDKK